MIRNMANQPNLIDFNPPWLSPDLGDDDRPTQSARTSIVTGSLTASGGNQSGRLAILRFLG